MHAFVDDIRNRVYQPYTIIRDGGTYCTPAHDALCRAIAPPCSLRLPTSPSRQPDRQMSAERRAVPGERQRAVVPSETDGVVCGHGNNRER